MKCYACQAPDVQEVQQQHTWIYGIGPSAVDLSAVVPTLVCSQCEETFFGEGAEDIQHETVCHYLGVLSHRELIKLRTEAGLTQEELAVRAEVRKEDILHWETGLRIQKSDTDKMLRRILTKVS